MIHFGKAPQTGDLEIRISPDEVGEVYETLQSAGLLQRRAFDPMKRYIEREYQAELAQYRRRMTAQVAVKQQ